MTRLDHMKVAAIILAAGAMTGITSAQVASALVREGDAVPGNPAQFVASISSPDTNGIGGWAVQINHDDGLGGPTITSAVGSADGVAAAAILRSEAVIGLLTQTSWEFDIGLGDGGQIGYSASGTGAATSDGGFDSAWIDATAFAVEGELITSGAAAGQFWSFASGPALSDNAVLLFVGGTRASVDGSTTARGLFDSFGNSLLYSGVPVPGLPAPLDDSGSPVSFDIGHSSQNSNYLVDVELETTGTGVSTTADNALVLTGQGLFIDGVLCQEDNPVPASAGGQAGEVWDNFDSLGVNEFGEYLFTGDTNAGAGGTAQDEIVVVNGQIVLREGDSVGGFVVNGAIENAAFNENGDWAVIWDIDDPIDGNVEALIVNGALVVREGGEVDWDGDGVLDAGAVINGTSFSGIRAMSMGDRDLVTGDATVYFTAEISDNGAADVEGFFAVAVPTTPGLAGDVAVNVTDTPDPLLAVPGSLSYKVAVRNNSPAAVTGVVTTTMLDSGLTFNSGASDVIAMDAGGNAVTANVGTLQPNEIFTFTIVADAAAAGSLSTTTTVAANEADGDPSNNSVTNLTDAGSSTDLAISISDSPDPLTDLAGMITYSVTIDNLGPSDATGIVVDLSLDPTTTFNAVLSDPIAVDGGGGMVSASIGALASISSTSFDVVVDVSTQALVTVSGSVTGNESDPESANNSAAEDTNVELFTDLEVTIADSPDPLLPSGGNIVYTVTTTNNGPSNATGVVTTVTLDGTTVFSAADAPGTHDGSPMGGDVTAAIGGLISGGSAVFTVTAAAPTTGRPAALATVAGSGNETDDDATNNSAAVSTLVIDNTVGLPTGVFSNIPSQANSDVPGLVGAKFGTGLDRPFISPDGTRYIISADTDLATTTDEVILVGQTSDGSATTVVQEGVTTLDLFDLVGAIDTTLSINDSGQYAFATNTNGPTTTDEAIVKWDGVTFVTVAREEDFAAPTLALYGATLSTPNIVADGTTWFIADTDGITAADLFVLSDDGATIVAQEGTTGIGLALWQGFDTDDLSVDATGANYLLQGDDDGTTTTDDILALNSTVVVRENEVLPGSGFADTVDATSPVERSRMMPNGDWYARGDNNDGTDWVIRNGAVIAERGQPIFTGAAERWSDASFLAGFFLFAANGNGDFIIGGATDASDDTADSVLVLNNERVIVREGDPIDLDNNGLFDDNVKVRTFGNDDAILTDDGVVYVTCTMRAGDDAGSNTDVGDALIRIATGDAPCPCDLNGDDDVDVLDLLDFLDVWFVGDPGSDYNNDGSFASDVLDLLDFLSCWFPASSGTCE